MPQPESGVQAVGGEGFKPAVQPGADHLDLERQRFAGQPQATFEPQHLVIADQLRQQGLHGGAIQQNAIDLQVLANNRHM